MTFELSYRTCETAHRCRVC